MRNLPVHLGSRSYEITIASGLLDHVGETIREVCPKARHIYVVTDQNVANLGYARRVQDSLERAAYSVSVFSVTPGEGAKSVGVLSNLWENLVQGGITRTDIVVALGGGVVGDLAGFAAATVLRGVDFVQIPTTLLAQVDSSVGGKVAIDLVHGKNLAGAFWQPKAVLMDPDTLNTLPPDVFSHGMAEVIKYGCIRDADFFHFLAAHPSREQIMQEIEHVLYVCCNIKREIVEQDEHDTGLRMLLNFGHTLGHAYELAGNYQTWTHGQAVSAGMCAAAWIGADLRVTPSHVAAAIADLCEAFGLPRVISCSMDNYAAAIGRDKKNAGDQISVILLDRIGHAILYPMTCDALLKQVQSLEEYRRQEVVL